MLLLLSSKGKSSEIGHDEPVAFFTTEDDWYVYLQCISVNSNETVYNVDYTKLWINGGIKIKDLSLKLCANVDDLFLSGMKWKFMLIGF